MATSPLGKRFEALERKQKKSSKKREAIADNGSNAQSSADNYGNTLDNQTENQEQAQNPEQPLKRNHGESNADYYHRQKAAEQKQTENKEKPQKPGLIRRGVQKGKDYANDKINKTKEYGAQKGKEGVEYAKGKGREFLDKNPQVAEKINKAKEAKENFENRMGGMKENLQSAPIKQEPGESSYAFRQRQKKQDDESYDPIQNRSLKDVAGQRLRTDANKRIGQTLKNNPRAAAALARANEIKKQVALKAQKFSNRAKALNAKAKALNAKLKEIKKQLDIKQRIKDEIKKYIIRLLWPAISGALLILGKLFIVVMIIVIIFSALKSTCESNPLFDAVCSYFIGVSY